MASFLDRITSHGATAKPLTQEQAARSVLVSNIPPQTADENIVIHFQKLKYGGGEIDHVHFMNGLNEGTAVITFESKEAAERVLEYSHILGESKLRLRQFTAKDLSEFLQQVLSEVLDNGVKLSLYQGDITDERVDVIVNTANEMLQHRFGVAGAIVRKGGRQIQDESNQLIKCYGPLDVGGTAYTSGGYLACRYVIHTVSPEWRKHGKDRSKSLLRRACIESLRLAAVKLQLSSIALTAISCGIFGMPKDICAQIMFSAVEEFSSSNEAAFSTLRDVRIVIIDEPTMSVFQEAFVKRYLFPEASPETVTTQGRPSDDHIATPQVPTMEPEEPDSVPVVNSVKGNERTGSETFSGIGIGRGRSNLAPKFQISPQKEGSVTPNLYFQGLKLEMRAGGDKESSPARTARIERNESWRNELAQMRRSLDDEVRLHNTREQELDRLQKILEEEQDRIQNDLEKLRKTLDDKARSVDELQRALREQQEARTAVEEELSQAKIDYTKLEERLQNEQLSYQALQQDIQTKENVISEQQRRLEEKHQQKTALEERLRSVEQRMEEERNNHLSTERELRSAMSAAENAMVEYRRHETRDWIIQRKEVVLNVEKIVGEGAWGNVCEGKFRGCLVAVKKIHKLILSDYNRRLFEREMSIASRCRHPNLLQFIGATNDEESPLFVAELLDTSLRNVLHQRALNRGEIVIIALDVAKGLNYLHLNIPLPIMHRDISSANVLLWRRDDSWRAKLSDYGAANFLRQSMTLNAGAIIYSAPEAFTPQQSTKVDVYSFGVLLCEMCIREQPDPQELHNQIGRVKQEALQGLIQRCVKTDPEARPTMSEVIHELEQLV